MSNLMPEEMEFLELQERDGSRCVDCLHLDAFHYNDGAGGVRCLIPHTSDKYKRTDGTCLRSLSNTPHTVLTDTN